MHRHILVVLKDRILIYVDLGMIDAQDFYQDVRKNK